MDEVPFVYVWLTKSTYAPCSTDLNSRSYRRMQKSTFWAAHLNSGARRVDFATPFIPTRRIYLYGWLSSFLDLAGAMPMKYYDSVRNTLEMCMRAAVVGVQLRSLSRIGVYVLGRWFIATTS
jgi:hypothetical protein